MGHYNLEECSLYSYIQIANKDIYIFDSHNMALPVWGTYSSRNNAEFNLVTFDSHTDTRPAFATEILNRTDFHFESERRIAKEILKGKHYRTDDFDFEDVFKISCNYVMNDEHIMTAEYFGYIKSYYIICDLDAFEAKSYERDDQVSGYSAQYFTREQQSQIKYEDIDMPLILDFDLDYFISDNCIDDKFVQAITPLVKNATVITIAREPEYFEKCKKQQSYTCEKAQKDVLMMIEQILSV